MALEFPNLEGLTIREQRETWKNAIKQIAQQTQQSYINARMYPKDQDLQNTHRENEEALAYLRVARDEWEESLTSK